LSGTIAWWPLDNASESVSWELPFHEDCSVGVTAVSKPFLWTDSDAGQLVIAVGASDGSIAIFAVRDGTLVRRLVSPHSRGVTSLAVHHRTLASEPVQLVSVSVDGTALRWSLHPRVVVQDDEPTRFYGRPCPQIENDSRSGNWKCHKSEKFGTS
jgi:WD40 repeat protein